MVETGGTPYLAYRHEMLPLKHILAQYAYFLRKVEKGKFKWGSKSAIQELERQLLLCVSTHHRGGDGGRGSDRSKSKSVSKKERKKYCLEFNRGTCSFNAGDEGKLNGVTVFKHHICKKCLVDDNTTVTTRRKSVIKNDSIAD